MTESAIHRDWSCVPAREGPLGGGDAGEGVDVFLSMLRLSPAWSYLEPTYGHFGAEGRRRID